MRVNGGFGFVGFNGRISGIACFGFIVALVFIFGLFPSAADKACYHKYCKQDCDNFFEHNFSSD